MRRPGLSRYAAGAGLYDLLSFEKPVYRVGRMHAIAELALNEGDSVLDIGCGTGLNFPHLRSRIGPTGHIVGVDASAAMLAQAWRKVHPEENVELLHGDAGRLDELVSGWSFDATIFTYSLSIIDDWRSVWAAALRNTRPGGRVGVVDLALPKGFGRILEPLARFACFSGGVHLDRRPWTLARDDLADVTVGTHRSGHVVVAVGTKRSAGTKRAVGTKRTGEAAR